MRELAALTLHSPVATRSLSGVVAAACPPRTQRASAPRRVHCSVTAECAARTRRMRVYRLSAHRRRLVVCISRAAVAAMSTSVTRKPCAHTLARLQAFAAWALCYLLSSVAPRRAAQLSIRQTDGTADALCRCRPPCGIHRIQRDDSGPLNAREQSME